MNDDHQIAVSVQEASERKAFFFCNITFPVLCFAFLVTVCVILRLNESTYLLLYVVGVLPWAILGWLGARYHKRRFHFSNEVGEETPYARLWPLEFHWCFGAAILVTSALALSFSTLFLFLRWMAGDLGAWEWFMKLGSHRLGG